MNPEKNLFPKEEERNRSRKKKEKNGAIKVKIEAQNNQNELRRQSMAVEITQADLKKNFQHLIKYQSWLILKLREGFLMGL